VQDSNGEENLAITGMRTEVIKFVNKCRICQHEKGKK
jgi:hypothetical protein